MNDENTITPSVLAARLKWLEALESGRYRQATHRLRRGDSFCCLGVCYDLLGQGKWIKDATYSADISAPAGLWTYLDPEDEPQAHGLSSAFRRRIGLTSELEGRLIKMNDAEVPFPTIAAFLRAEWALPRSSPANPTGTDLPPTNASEGSA